MHKLMRTVFKIVPIVMLAVALGASLAAHAQTQDAAPPEQAPRGTPSAYEAGTQRANESRDTSSSIKSPPTTATDPSDGAGIGGTFLAWIGLKGLGWAIFIINYIVGMIGSVAFTLAGLLVEFGLYLNTTMLMSSVVQLGWRITRDLANLGFTVGIVVIAYATMLGYESYGVKKTLFGFIVAAVLVNFSFGIAGFFIDGSNMVTNFFVTKSIGGAPGDAAANAHKFAVNLAGAFGPQRLLMTSESSPEAFQALQSNGGIIALILSVFFIALFTIFAALGMLAVGLTTFRRFAYLSCLVVVMPAAILCSVFPKTKTYWNRWQSLFWAQMIYLPVATFSIYLILMFMDLKSRVSAPGGPLGASQLADALSKIPTSTFDQTLSLMAQPFRVMSDMIIVLTLLFVSIIETNRMSGAGGKIAVDMTKDAAGWAIGTVRRTPGGTARKTLTAGEDPEKNLGNRLGNAMSKVPLVRRFVPGLKGFMAGANRNIETYGKEYAGLNDAQLLNTARSAEIRLNPERMAAVARIIGSRGLWNEAGGGEGISEKDFESYIPAIRRFGMERDIMKTAPHLYAKLGMSVSDLDEFMDRSFKADDMEYVSAESLKDPVIASRLSARHIAKLNAPDKEEHRKALISAIEGFDQPSFRTFMKTSFGRNKDVDEAHPDLLRSKRFVMGLQPFHIERMGKEPDAAQQMQALATMKEAYRDSGITSDPTELQHLDGLAAAIVDKKGLWSVIASDPEAAKDFAAIEAVYRVRHPNPAATGAQQNTKANNQQPKAPAPPTATSVPTTPPPAPPAAGAPAGQPTPPRKPAPPAYASGRTWKTDSNPYNKDLGDDAASSPGTNPTIQPTQPKNPAPNNSFGRTSRSNNPQTP